MSETAENSVEPVVLISGGSRGIGRALVARFLEIGRVATFSRSTSDQFFASANISGHLDRLFYAQVDASDSPSLERFVQQTLDRFGYITGLINNAAIAVDGVLALTPEHQIQKVLDVNLRSVLVLTKECVRAMLREEYGSILSISSIIAERGFAGLSTYAATKAGLIGMTRSLARELGPRNIRVNALAPGYVETEMSESLSESQRQQIIRRTPLGRLATVEDIVPVVEFLMSPASLFITGQTIMVDGGASV
jgi:3-oxoacyl-[acyl-carrier protein] reductase